MKIHNLPVLAQAIVEVQHGVECYVVLVQTRSKFDQIRDGHPNPMDEYVVAWYRAGDREWNSGNYVTDIAKAWSIFIERVRTNGGVRPYAHLGENFP